MTHTIKACTAPVCGNYDRQYENCCRALTGRVPDDYFDCPAFCSFAEASSLDRQMLAACTRERDYERLRYEIMSRNNPRRRQSFYPKWWPGEKNPLTPDER